MTKFQRQDKNSLEKQIIEADEMVNHFTWLIKLSETRYPKGYIGNYQKELDKWSDKEFKLRIQLNNLLEEIERSQTISNSKLEVSY